MSSTIEIVGDFAFRTVCETHNFRPFVGKNVAFALGEYDCPSCVAEIDRAAEERRFRIENSYYGTITGHHPECLCDTCFPCEPEGWELFQVSILSPDFCDHSAAPNEICSQQSCAHAACVESRENPPF